MSAAIYLPRISRIGAGTLASLPDVLSELGLNTALIVTDPVMAEQGYLQRVKDLLPTAGVFDACVPDPTTDSVAAALACWNEGDYDCVIGLGGGSSMDTAKAMAVLAQHGGRRRDYKMPNPVPAGVPVIAIPTTAGTGSEATRVTVVTDTETDEKMPCAGIGFLPIAAIVDYELTLTMPPRLTADTGLDAICHALEAYVSRKACAYTDALALTALSSLSTNIRTAYAEPENREAREAMMLGAHQAGIAFSNASVTLIHGMSRPIGAFFHVPHGLSNAMLLPRITEFSIPGCPERYADCAVAMDFAEADASIDVACEQLMKGLYTLCADLQVPSLSAFGVDAARFEALVPTMAQQALASGSPANNPRLPEQQEIEALYREVWA
jgi:alcohol dehydrogenase class IV